MYIDQTTITPNTLTEVTQTDSTLTTTEITNSIPTTTEVDLINFETKTMRTMNVEKTTVGVSKANDSSENGLNKGARVGENNITDTYPRTTVGLDENEFSSVIDDNITVTTESGDMQTTQATTDYANVQTTTISDNDTETDFTRSDSVITTKSTKSPKNTTTSKVPSTEPADVTTNEPTTELTTTPITMANSLRNHTTTTESLNMDFQPTTESDDSFRMMDTTKSSDGTTHSENTRKTTRIDTSLEHQDEQTTKIATGMTETTDASTLLTTNDAIARTDVSIIDSVTKAITQKCNRTTDCTTNEQCVDGRCLTICDANINVNCTKGILIIFLFLSFNEKS